ncbi:fatty acyl-AMP ligase [Gluconobacter sp. P5B12]|uniref:fatty acyl-AMP ligase n=1 Tax=unclassified Gluconobacter TaxID=2644261 RepID=UPI001C05C0D2|nr:fatty acyl-AMP ligase [Gluconobacter sp. P5B12]
MIQPFATVLAADGKEMLDWQRSTIVDALFFHASRTPDLKVYTLLGDGENETDAVTASQLAAQATALATWLRRMLSPGSRVLLLYESSLDYIRGLLGCLCAGLVPVSGVYPKAFGARDRFIALRDDAEAAAVIGNRSILTEFQKVCPDKIDGPRFLWIPTDKIRPSAKPESVAHPSPEDVALIQYTSGSTRTPRGVLLTHRNIAHNLFRQAEAFGYRQGDCGVNWLPLSHDMGLIGGALMTLATGGRCILLPPEAVAEKPIRWLQAISHYRATLSGGPNFAYGMCVRSIAPEEVASLDLSCWEVAFNGAEYIRAETMQSFTERFASSGFDERAFFACYGLAEATLLVTASERGQGVSFREFSRDGLAHGHAMPPHNNLGRRLLAGCGRPPSDIIVRIADADTEAVLPDGAVGEIRIHSPGVATGYVNRPVENSQVFQGRVAGEEGTFLRTGDRGFLLDGILYVTGRQDNRIRLGDSVLDPEDIIACLGEFEADIRLFSTAVFEESTEDGTTLVLVTELPSGSAGDLTQLGKAIGEKICAHFPASRCRIVFLRASAILKTPSGKIRVGETKKELLQGNIPILGEYTYSPLGSGRVRILKIAEGKM